MSDLFHGSRGKINKAPGLDGSTIDFYQECWSFLVKDVYEVVKQSRQTRKILPILNATFISSIPKQGKSKSLDDYRPITLFNVIYKIIAFMIVNRLKPLLPNLISLEQTWFVEVRKIVDGIIVVWEIIHSFKWTKRLGMFVKLDLSKTYDIIRWFFEFKDLQEFSLLRNGWNGLVPLFPQHFSQFYITYHLLKLFIPLEALEKVTLCHFFSLYWPWKVSEECFKKTTNQIIYMVCVCMGRVFLLHIYSSWMMYYYLVSLPGNRFVGWRKSLTILCSPLEWWFIKRKHKFSFSIS